MCFDVELRGSQCQTLKCPFCGHEDYMDAWLGKSQSRKASEDGEILKEIRFLINDSTLKEELNRQFDAISRKYHLSTLTLLRLVNVIAANENDSGGNTLRLNPHRYSKIEEKSISGEALLEIVMQQLAVKEQKESAEASVSLDDDSVSALQDNYSELERKHLQLKKDYDTLRMENERLKKEIEKYKDFWE